jgi:SpoVK/Ycf46/Vps4 family AAA+-type ATPase
MKKLLYPITCGDLGSTAQEVEMNLKKHFTLASRWDCVMLLDEADVFLARRKSEDLHRNSIVSVFLRMLEYYKGLLFLTTNRVGASDEAFKSRVHISLFCKYNPSICQPDTDATT